MGLARVEPHLGPQEGTAELLIPGDNRIDVDRWLAVQREVHDGAKWGQISVIVDRTACSEASERVTS